MAIIKFNPFTPWASDRFLSSWDDDDSWPQMPLRDNLDVYETDSEIVVKAAVPGIPADKVEVTFEDGVLRIKAQVEDSDEEKKARKVVYRQQRMSYFDYTTSLPRAVDGNKIAASVENGVVIVKAPIAETAKPKKITVKTK